MAGLHANLLAHYFIYFKAHEEISKEKILESFQGWQAYAKWANTFKLRKKVDKVEWIKDL